MVLDDESMIQLENRPEMMKSMSGVEKEAGEIKSPKKSVGKALSDVEDVSVGEVISIARWLISFGIPRQGSMEEEVSGVKEEDPRLEVRGGDQSSSDMEEL